MSGIETTALTVEFIDSALTSSASLRMERSNKEPEDIKDMYFRIHGMDDHVISSTSGSVRMSQANVSKFVSEFLYFNGTTQTELNYAGSFDVEFIKYGSYVGTDGQRLRANDVHLSFDPVKNAVVSDKPIYGVISISYRSRYELWVASFGGSCPSTENTYPPVDISQGGPDDDVLYEGLEPMVIYGFKDGVLAASLPLDPPACDLNWGSYVSSKSRMGSGLPTIKIEEDKEYPIRYLTAGSGLEAGCSLRVYPADINITFSTTSGKVFSSDGKFIKQIEEAITFSNSGTTRLRYQPKGSVSVKPSGKFVDEYGRTFEPSFRTTGQACTVVTWVSKYAYTNPQRRTVERDEVVVTSTAGKVVPAYGSAIATYSVEYNLHPFQFDLDPETGSFSSAFVVGASSDASQTGTIGLEPPPRRGFV
jgi:hypothetical protein